MKLFRGVRFALPISLAMWGMILIAGVKAFGQETKGVVDVPFTSSERVVMLDMCEAAKYGYAAQFTPVCSLLKRKFEEAEKAAAQRAESPKKD